ncbi:MAG TPA: choice-of-anchor D domain-containing protein, partial [Steroidobacteraceae bacterium]|nr:choice-of-anchor D domain-containing protein [Steroidobacteraceae bacterium]
EVETRVEGDAASDFVLERSCASVAPGEKCELVVRFKPTLAAQRSAQLVVSEGNGRLFIRSDLRGTGTEAPPVVDLRLDPKAHDFGTQVVGTSSQLARFELENRSKEKNVQVDVRVNGDAARDFVLERTCDSVNAGGECELAIRFTPTVEKPRRAHLMVTAANEEVNLRSDLSGAGAPVDTLARRSIAFDPPQVVFRDALVGGERQRARVRIINEDNETFPVAVRLGNETTMSLVGNTCAAATLQAASDCRVDIEFNPRAAGQHQTNLVVTDDRKFVSSLRIRALVTESSGIIFTPNPASFAPRPTGTTSAALPVMLRNSSGASFNASYAQLDAVTADNFVVAGLCQKFFYGPHSECRETVHFRPRSAGAHSGTVLVRDDSGAVIGTLKLEGSGQPLAMYVDPDKLDFSPPQKSDQVVTVTNAGGADFVIGPVRLISNDTKAFLHDSPPCLSVRLKAKDSCTIGVHYRAGLTGTAQTRSAELVIEPESLPATRVPLVWNRPPEPNVTARPPALSFGRVPFGSAKALDVTFFNSGNGPASRFVVGFLSDNTPFSVGNVCSSLEANSQCTVTVTFRPTQAGPVNATLRAFDASTLAILTTVEVDGDGVSD